MNKAFLSLAALIATVFVLSGLTFAQDAPKPPGEPMNDVEKAFSERMTGAVLTGRFTIDGDDAPPKTERYEIVSAKKVGEHDWLIVARVVYGENDLRVPVPVKIHWAGDTAVLSLTDLAIPGLGTFTSRVMFTETRYAGTWQHDDKGGHLFGTIGKVEEEQEQPPAPEEKQLQGIYDETKKLYEEFQTVSAKGSDSAELKEFHRRFRTRQRELFKALAQAKSGSPEMQVRRLITALGTVCEAHRRGLDLEKRKPFDDSLAGQFNKVEELLGKRPESAPDDNENQDDE